MDVGLDCVVERGQPRRVVDRGLGARHERRVGLVTERHDVLVLVVLQRRDEQGDKGGVRLSFRTKVIWYSPHLPLKKALHHTLNVKGWVVGETLKSLGVGGLVTDVGLVRGFDGLLRRPAHLPLRVHGLPVGEGDPFEDEVPGVPSCDENEERGEEEIC